MVRHHCPVCNSQRPADVCWKCGTLCNTPAAEWDYPELPDPAPLAEVARTLGYAIAVHGSQQRDLDLVAVPWVEEAVSPDDLIRHLVEELDLIQIGDVEHKPLHRVAVSLQPRGWFKHIDLSIVTPCTYFQPT